MTATVVAPLDLAEAEALLADRWGLRGEVAPLGSHEDLNVVLTGPAGRHVLKVTSPATTAGELDAQSAGLARLAEAGLPFATPRTVPTLDGATVVAIETGAGVHLARVLTWVDGRPLSGWHHLAPPVRHALGQVAGRTSAALDGLSHPALDRPFTWDLRRASDVVRSLVRSVASADRRARALEVVGRSDDALDRLSPDLRTTTVHGDVTDLNVVAGPGLDGRPVPCGLIDVGDLSTGWVVAEAGVAACSAVPHDLDRALDAVCDVLRGFDDVRRLGDAEVEAAWWVVLSRAAVLATTTEHQATIDPTNDYVLGAIEREWAALDALVAIPAPVAHAAVRLALGRAPVRRRAVSLPPVERPLLDGQVGPVLDLSTTSDHLQPGVWADRRALAVLIAGFGVGAVGPQGDGRLVAPHPVQDEPPTVSLGVEVLTAIGAAVRAPFPLVVRRADEGGVGDQPGDDLMVLAPTARPRIGGSRHRPGGRGPRHRSGRVGGRHRGGRRPDRTGAAPPGHLADPRPRGRGPDRDRAPAPRPPEPGRRLAGDVPRPVAAPRAGARGGRGRLDRTPPPSGPGARRPSPGCRSTTGTRRPRSSAGGAPGSTTPTAGRTSTRSTTSPSSATATPRSPTR